MEKIYSKEATIKLSYHINVVYGALIERYGDKLSFINGGVGLRVGTTEIWYSKTKGLTTPDFGNEGYSTLDEVASTIAKFIVKSCLYEQLKSSINSMKITKYCLDELSNNNTYKINNLFYNGKNNYELFHNNLKLRSGVVDSIDPHAGSMVGLFHALNHAKNNGYDYIKVITVNRVGVYYNKLMRTDLSRDFHDRIVEKNLDKINIVFSYVD